MALILDGNGSISGIVGAISQGSNPFYSNDYILYGTTTDATLTEIYVSGSAGSRIAVANNSTMMYEVNIVARRTDVAGEAAAWHLKGCVKNINGTVSDVGDVYEVLVAADDATLTVDAQADDTNSSLKVLVSGSAGKTYVWVAAVKTIEVY